MDYCLNVSGIRTTKGINTTKIEMCQEVKLLLRRLMHGQEGLNLSYCIGLAH